VLERQIWPEQTDELAEGEVLVVVVEVLALASE